MKTKAELEAMSVDEITDYKLSIKRQMAELRSFLVEATQVQNEKIRAERESDLLNAMGLTGMKLVPDPAVLTANGH